MRTWFWIFSLAIYSLVPGTTSAQETGSVTLIYEAASSVPPFYPGKALPPPEASVKVVALPRIIEGGKVAPPTELQFTWKKNGKVLGEDSGLGKSYVFVESGRAPGESILIEVEVRSTLNSVARGVISVPTFSPFVLFYQKSPLLGVLFEEALIRSFTLSEKELSLSAFPFFFEAASRNSSSLKYAWKINGAVPDGVSQGPEITLRQESPGSYLVSLNTENAGKIGEASETSLRVDLKGASGQF